MPFAELTWNEGIIGALGTLLAGTIAAIAGLIVKLRETKATTRKVESATTSKEARDRQRQRQEEVDWAVKHAREAAQRSEAAEARLREELYETLEHKKNCEIALAIISSRLKDAEEKLGIVREGPDELSMLIERFQVDHKKRVAPPEARESEDEAKGNPHPDR